MERLNFANAQDNDLEKVISRRDIPQNLQINGVYELPFGKGKPFVANAHPVVGRLLGGWEISGIARIQEGMPIDFTARRARTHDGAEYSIRAIRPVNARWWVVGRPRAGPGGRERSPEFC